VFTEVLGRVLGALMADLCAKVITGKAATNRQRANAAAVPPRLSLLAALETVVVDAFALACLFVSMIKRVPLNRINR
jgi:hypothetical protein